MTMRNFKLVYTILNLLGFMVLSETSRKVCDKLSKTPWQKYDTSSVPEKSGIYAIGQKVGSKETKYLYVGRSNDMKRRLQEHKTPTPQQVIDKRVAGKFKQHKESDLKIKFVPEKNQKSKEGAYIDCLTKKNGKRPALNKRAGDGCTSCAGGQKRSTKSKAHTSGPKMQSSGRASSSSGPKVGTSGSPKVRSSSSHKLQSSGKAPSMRSSSGPRVGSSGGLKVRSSGSPKLQSSGKAPSMRSSSGPRVGSSGGLNARSSGSPKVRSGGRSSFRSFGGRRGR